MLKKTIKYSTVDGEEVTGDFYFHLSAAEIAELELTYPGGFSNALKEIGDSGNPALIIKTFKDLLARTYGVRSDDGKRFVKSPELWTEFTQTDAYSQFFLSLVTDPTAAVEFVNGVIPKDLREKALAAVAPTQEVEKVDNRPAWIRENRTPTKRELMEMTPEQLAEAFRARLAE